MPFVSLYRRAGNCGKSALAGLWRRVEGSKKTEYYAGAGNGIMLSRVEPILSGFFQKLDKRPSLPGKHGKGQIKRSPADVKGGGRGRLGGTHKAKGASRQANPFINKIGLSLAKTPSGL